MSSRLIRFLTVLTILLLYTDFKVAQLLGLISPGFALATLITVGVFGVMIGWQFIYRAKPEVFNQLWFRGLAWLGSIVMGLWATFIIISIPLDLVEVFIAGIGRLSHAAAETPEAAVHPIGIALRLGLLGIAGGITVLGFIAVVRGPMVRRVTADFKSLPSALKDLKIAQISDLHVGALIRADYVEDVVRRTNALEPDIVVLTGDLGDGKAAMLAPDMQPLRDLRARYGVFYCTGNHEYYWGAQGIIAELESLGITPLLNSNRVLTIDGTKVLVAGITDPAGEYFIPDHRPDMAKALTSNEDCALKILLSHRPGVCDEAEERGVDLQFSGHTHAGQFFPFSLFIPFAHKYFRGLNRHGRLWLYVNVGTGYWGPPNRLAVGSEITLLTCEPS